MRKSEKIEMQIRQESKKCLYRTTEMPIEDIISFYNETRFQKKWDNNKKSLYIESLLLSYPLRSFIFVESNEGYLIVDGNERINSIIEFINGDLLLNVKKISKLKGLGYKNLILSRQRNFLRKSIRITVLNESTDDETIKYIYSSCNIQLIV